jgi:cardiolipin synthase
VLNVPNSLTIVRILTIPGFLILLTSGHASMALALFIIGGLTDALDGAIARLTDSKTELGAVLDPLADKLLLLSSFCVLALLGAVPSWLTVLVIIRDVILLAGYIALFVVSGERIAVRPSAVGKATTLFQLASVTVVLVDLVWPGTQYMVRGLSWLQQRPSASPQTPLR